MTHEESAARSLYDLALEFQERSQQSEARLLEQFEDAAARLVGRIGELIVVDNDDERLVLGADGHFRAEVLPEDSDGEWRTLGDPDELVEYYGPTDVFGDLAAAMAASPPIEPMTAWSNPAEPAATTKVLPATFLGDLAAAMAASPPIEPMTAWSNPAEPAATTKVLPATFLRALGIVALFWLVVGTGLSISIPVYYGTTSIWPPLMFFIGVGLAILDSHPRLGGPVDRVVWTQSGESPAPAATPMTVAPISDTKACPDCAEAVLAEARICRFCRFEF